MGGFNESYTDGLANFRDAISPPFKSHKVKEYAIKIFVRVIRGSFYPEYQLVLSSLYSRNSKMRCLLGLLLCVCAVLGLIEGKEQFKVVFTIA